MPTEKRGPHELIEAINKALPDDVPLSEAAYALLCCLKPMLDRLPPAYHTATLAILLDRPSAATH